MSIRRAIEEKKRRIMTVALFGFAIAAGSALLAGLDILDLDDLRLVSLPGVIIFTLSMLYANLLAFRCPRCGGNWASLAMQGSLKAGIRCFLDLDERICFCPYCGSSIDDELDAEQVRAER